MVPNGRKPTHCVCLTRLPGAGGGGGQERLGGPARYAGVSLVSHKGLEPVSLGSMHVPWALGLSSFFSADIMRHRGGERK